MKIEHIAVYALDLERMRAFYERYFGACTGAKYHNPKTGLQTYFLRFSDGARLELMTRPEVAARERAQAEQGLIHLCFSVGAREEVDALTERLRKDGFAVISGPRVTGDGYYESCVLDPEGNQVELVSG